MKRTTLILIIAGLTAVVIGLTYNYKNRAVIEDIKNNQIYEEEIKEPLEEKTEHISQKIEQTAENIKEEVKTELDQVKEEVKKPNEPAPKKQTKPAPAPNQAPTPAPECKPAPAPGPAPGPTPAPGPITPELPPATGQYLKEVEKAIFNLVNNYRVENGVSPLNYDKTLEGYAEYKAQDMAGRKYFSHEDPDGKLISDIMKSNGVKFSAWGENIAYISTGAEVSAQDLANQFFNNWINSEGHRKNILNAGYDKIGVGIYKIGNTYFATQQFTK